MLVQQLAHVARKKAASAGGWDLASASYDTNKVDGTAGGTQLRGVRFSPTGTTLFLCDNSDDEMRQFDLSTPWDLSTASHISGNDFGLSVGSYTPNGFFVGDSGTKLFSAQNGASDRVRRYPLTSGWDLSTAGGFDQFVDISSQVGGPRDVFFRSNGERMYVLDSADEHIHQWNLSTPWDLSTATHDSGGTLDVSSQESDAHSFYIRSDGKRLYVTGWTNDTVYQYTMSTPWDITTASYDSVSFSVNSQATGPNGLEFKPDGTKMFVTDVTNDEIYRYSVP